MQSIVYVGMDVHVENITFACYEESKGIYAQNQVKDADWKSVIKYLEKIQKERPKEEIHFVCGYEAGCLGYSLYHELMRAETKISLDCIIMAPTTMAVQGNKPKTDRRDSVMIAKNLAYGTYSKVYVVDDEDNGVKDFIRMRDDTKVRCKSIKQQLLALCLRHGKRYSDGTNWTIRHREWLRKLDLGEKNSNRALQEYLRQLAIVEEDLERYDREIEEIAQEERYSEKVGQLKCLKGIRTVSALATIVEIGDFRRFATAEKFAAFLGLVPGEHSSGGTIIRTPITKHGNNHLRRLMVEAAQSYSRGSIYLKSKSMRSKQSGQDQDIIDYCDRQNLFMMRKYHRLCERGKNSNVAKTAIARQLACSIWGIMTGNVA
ncbi:MAG: IS110 family transposase [Oscillospiraceae bacterium]|nr:IS110 family transposase [Oscillospiraceae bacterium]